MIVSDLPCAFPSSPMLAPLPLRSSRSITIDCSAKSPIPNSNKLLLRPASDNIFDFARDMDELCCIERSGDLCGHRDAVNGPRHNSLNGKRYPHRLPPHNTSPAHNSPTPTLSPVPPSVGATGTGTHHTTPSHNPARAALSPLSVPLSVSDSVCSWRDLQQRPLPSLPAISPPAGIAIEDRDEEELEQRECERDRERDELDALFDSCGCASPLTTTSSLDSTDNHTSRSHNNHNNNNNSNNNALFPSSRPQSHASRCSYTHRDTQGQQKELVRIPSLSAFFREHECRSVPSSPTPSRPCSARSVSSAVSTDSHYSTYSTCSTDSAGVDMVSVASLSLSQCSSRAGSRPGSARTSRASSRFGVRPFRCASPTDRGVVDDPADSLKRKIKKSFSVDVHEMQGIML